MVELTADEKALLKEIMTDKFAAGPFAGMIFNVWENKDTAELDSLIKEALRVRLRLKELAA